MKVAAAKSEIHGMGLFCVEDIASGEHVGTFEGHPTEHQDTHVLWYEELGQWHGLAVTNVLKFANHSLTPNTEVLGCDMYALRTIAKGEEVTFHYGDEWH